MQLTERHLIKPNHELYATLDDLTFKAKNLYNHGLYLYRQSYFEHKKNPEASVLTWVDIDKSLRKQGHEDIRALPSKVANPKQVRIVPNHNNFIIEVIYDAKEQELKSTAKYAGIDLGVDNFATITFSTHNNPLIIKGLELKSINQGYNRLIAKAQSLLPGTCKTSKSIHRLWSRRTWILTTKIHQITAFLANLFDEMQIEKVFIGKNTGWKHELPFGKKVKQRFAYLPYETFIEQLQYKCQLRGITVATQEESYTSKASFLDGDDIPTYGETDNPKFSGRRIKRGLYKTGKGQLINADVNGAYNILRKGLINNHLSFNVDSPLIQPLVVKGIGQEPNDKLVQLYM